MLQYAGGGYQALGRGGKVLDLPPKAKGHAYPHQPDGTVTDLYVKWLPFEITLDWLVQSLAAAGFIVQNFPVPPERIPMASESQKQQQKPKPMLTVWRSARPGHAPRPGTAQMRARAQAKMRIQGGIDPRDVQRHLSEICECDTRVERSHQEGWKEPSPRKCIHIRIYWPADEETRPLKDCADIFAMFAEKGYLSAITGIVCLCLTSSKHSLQPGVGRLELAGEFEAVSFAEQCHDALNETNLGGYIACIDYSDGITQFGRLQQQGPVLARDQILKFVRDRLRDHQAPWLLDAPGASSAAPPQPGVAPAQVAGGGRGEISAAPPQRTDPQRAAPSGQLRSPAPSPAAVSAGAAGAAPTAGDAAAHSAWRAGVPAVPCGTPPKQLAQGQQRQAGDEGTTTSGGRPEAWSAIEESDWTNSPDFDKSYRDSAFNQTQEAADVRSSDDIVGGDTAACGKLGPYLTDAARSATQGLPEAQA